MTAILNQIAEKWFSWQLSMFWQVGLLIIIIAGLDLLIKKWVWPQVRYALWLLILVKLVLPPTLTSPTSFTAEIPFMVKQTAIKISQPQTSPHTIKPAIVPVTELIPADTITQPVEIIPAPYTTPATPAGALLSGKTYVFFVWLGGVGILSGWLIIRLSNLRHQHLKDKQSNLPERLEDLLVSTARKLGLRKVPKAILTNKVCCPAVFGIFRPVLLMPADKLQNMTSQDAEHIFLHELAHIKRGDLFVHAVYMILQIAYWFNPLLWLIRKHLQNLRELCCDATVARLLKEKTAGYRQTLLETARQLLAQPVDPGLGLLGLFENSNWLIDRLRWLESKSWKYRSLRITTVFILICLMSTCVLPMTKIEAPVDFVIRGTVTDAQTGKPIAGAKVGDTEEYAEGRFSTTTDSNGNYSYKTWYEEHGIKAIAEGYQKERKTLLTKLFGSKKEKVINFALEPNGAGEQESSGAGKNLQKSAEYDSEKIIDGSIIESAYRRVKLLQERSESSTKLSRLGKMLLIYSNDNNEKYPDKLGQLKPYDKDGILSWALENVKYLGQGKTIMVESQAVIAYDNTLLQKGEGTSVLYNDNYAGFEKPEKLKKLGIKPKKENGKEIKVENPTGRDEVTSETNDVSKSSVAEKKVNAARALKIMVYEGNDLEPQTSVRIPLVAMKIVRQLLPSKDKLQIIAQKIKIDESLPEDMNSAMLIDMLDEMLKKLDEGVQATTLLEVKDGDERIIIALE